MKIKLINIVFFLLSFNLVLGQKRLSLFKDSKLIIVNSTIDKDPNSLPLLYFTILNKTRNDIIFNRVYLNISYFKKLPNSSSSNSKLVSKILTPIVVWNLNMPTAENTYLYDVNNPILLSPKDPITIKIRLFCNINGKNYVPSQIGEYKFTVTFITFDNKGLQSSQFIMGGDQ